MGLRCKRCGSEEQVKNGMMRGKPLAMKAAAVLLLDEPFSAVDQVTRRKLQRGGF